MTTKTLLTFTRTPLHIGAGSSLGDLDQPVQRERHTRHPIIPGSSIKGAFRAAATMAGFSQAEIDDTFGPENPDGKNAKAGNVAFGEARLVAFPIRSANGAFAYITCPHLLARLGREIGGNLSTLPTPKNQECYAEGDVKIGVAPHERVVLEEYAFAWKGVYPGDWKTTLLGLVDDIVWKMAGNRLVLLSDTDFSHFAFSATQLTPQVKIDPAKGTAVPGALFNLECVPAETLFASPVTFIGRTYGTDSGAKLAEFVSSHPMMQFGGDLTTGHGFCHVKLT